MNTGPSLPARLIVVPAAVISSTAPDNETPARGALLAQPWRLAGLVFDAGFDDQFTHIPPTSRAFSAALTDKGVEHRFEMYNGDHRNRLWGRQGRLYTEVLPYFSSLLQGDR